MDEIEIYKKLIALVKARGQITVSEAVGMLNIEDTRNNRDLLRKMFLRIGEEEKFIKLTTKRGAYVLEWDKEEELRVKEMKEREQLLKQKENIINDFLKNIIEEKTKRIIKKYVKENDSFVEKEVEEIKYYANVLYYDLLRKIADKKIENIHIIKTDKLFILLEEKQTYKNLYYDSTQGLTKYYEIPHKKIYTAYIIDKSFKYQLFEILKEFLETKKLDYYELGLISKIVKFIEIEEKEDKSDEIEELKEILEVV